MGYRTALRTEFCKSSSIKHNVRCSFMFATVSRASPLCQANQEPIHLVTQFYLPSDAARLAELQFVLRANISNPLVESVTLLNERIYTANELGIESPKVVQTLLGHRLRFNDVWAARKPGYTVLTNADIFVDATIARVRESDLHARRAMFALLRYEYPSGKLFGPRADSQDTWIVHSSLELKSAELNAFKFELGRPGCDNKVAYLFAAMGVEIYNDPVLIHTHHCHASPGRSYPEKVDAPYLFVCPANLPCTIYGNPLSEIRAMIQTYDFFACNTRLTTVLSADRFVIPRIAGIENNTAFAGAMGRSIPSGLRAAMKTNAGIHLPTPASIKAYSEAYLKPFHQCRAYASWEPWGNYFPHIAESQVYMQRSFPKAQVGAFVFDIFHYLSAPWTHALRGRRLLLVSPFVDMIQTQPLAYHTNLFPECTFVYVKPPQTHGSNPSRDWTVEFAELCAAVDAVEFDVALCSCGGYGNPLCGYIFSKGKSAIYVGGVLQMYFGIYGGRWIKERKDILTMYLNPDWKRPTVKPKGHAAIESSCYW